MIPYQIETLTHIQLVIRDKQATKDGRNNSQNSKKTRLKSISVPLAAQSMTSFNFLGRKPHFLKLCNAPLLPWEFLLVKKLEIEKTKTIFIISVLNVVYLVAK